MPYQSEKQMKFFEACRANPGGMHGKCPSKTILGEFHRAAKKAGQFRKGTKHG